MTTNETRYEQLSSEYLSLEWVLNCDPYSFQDGDEAANAQDDAELLLSAMSDMERDGTRRDGSGDLRREYVGYLEDAVIVMRHLASLSQ